MCPLLLEATGTRPIAQASNAKLRPRRAARASSELGERDPGQTFVGLDGLLVQKVVDRRIHGFVERLSGVADELDIRLRLEYLHEILEGLPVPELDKVL
jgi:hypothetical protein